MFYRSAQFFACLLVVTTAGAPVANAGTIGFTHITAFSSVPFADTFTLPNFNTSLGVLTGVDISLAYSISGSVEIFSIDGENETFTNATSAVPITLSALVGPFTLSTNAVVGPMAGTAIPGLNVFPGLTGAGSIDISIPTIDFSSFEVPPATFTDSYSIVGNGGTYGGTSVSGLFFGGTADVGGLTTVTYTYDPISRVPEPITLSLFGAGLAGAAVVRRRRKSAKQL